MNKVKFVLEESIAQVEQALEQSRDRLDNLKDGNPYSQCVVAQDISIAAAKLDTLKHLYKILGFEAVPNE